MKKLLAAIAALAMASIMSMGGAAPAQAGGNYLYVLTHAKWVDIHEGELGSTIADSCNDCYWVWEDYYVTWHGNSYHERIYNNGAGGSALVFFRKDANGDSRVGYETWWCGSTYQRVPQCDEVQDFRS